MMLVPPSLHSIRPPVCRAAVVLAPSFPPGGGGGGEVRRYNENQQSVRPSVRPTDESALRTRTQSEPPRRQQQQLEQQKQALWRLAQPGGRTETAEPWPTRSHFQPRCLLGYLPLLDMFLSTRKKHKYT